MENRKYLIIYKSEIDLVDFDLILSSPDFLPSTNNGEKVIVKWENMDDPEFINNFSWKEGPYNNEEINSIMYLPEWVISE